MKFAVIGSPISHSYSPKIHKSFGESLGIEVEYEAIEVNRESCEKSILRLLNEGYVGLNVTLPLKDLAYLSSAIRKSNSEATKTANTLWKQDGTIACDSTDGPGLVADLKKKGITTNGLNITIVGAGGSARAIVPSLLNENPKNLCVVNRTIENIDSLRSDLNLKEQDISGYDLDHVPDEVPDIIINCSSAGLKGDEVILPEGLFDKAEICYDLSYSLEETPFNLLARQHRVQKVYDGKGMLINQAALSFKIWTGKTPEIPEEQEIFT